MGNKITYGLKNVHYAPFSVVNGVINYETPVAIPGAVDITLDPRGDLVEFYADNIVYYSAQNNQGYDGTLNIANIPDSFAIDVLGDVENVADKVLTEKSDVKGKNFAFMFEFEGDIKATRYVLFNCTANRPTISSSTRTNTVEPNPRELTFIANPRETDNAVKTKTTTETPTNVYDNWYSAVYTNTADIVIPTVTVVPTDGATAIPVTSSVIWTFSEAINPADVIATNFLVIDSTGVEVAGTLSQDVTQAIITFTPTSNLAAATAYTAIAVKNIRDLAGNTIAANVFTNFTTA